MLSKIKINICFLLILSGTLFTSLAGCGKTISKSYKEETSEEKQRKENQEFLETAKKDFEKLELTAGELKIKADDLEIKAKDVEEKAKDLEKQAEKAENEALRTNSEALSKEAEKLKAEIKVAEKYLSRITEEGEKKEAKKAELLAKYKEIYKKTQQAKDKLDEITGRINIYSAKQRVEVIRGNTEEADSRGKKLDEAKVQEKSIEASYDKSSEELKGTTKELSALGVSKEELPAKPVTNSIHPAKPSGKEEEVPRNMAEPEESSSRPLLEGTPSEIFMEKSPERRSETKKSESPSLDDITARSSEPKPSLEIDALRNLRPAEPVTARTPEEKPRVVIKSASGLKAGYSDDNKQFNYFLNYLEQFKNLNHYPINVHERIILNVKDISGKSVPNAEIEILSNDNLLCSGLTYSDGSFLFFPSKYDTKITQYKAVISYMQARTEIQIERSGKREIEIKLDYQKNIKGNIPIDILFMLDVTGSMGEEIERLKATIEIINLNISSMTPKPDVRFGMVLYKDRGDDFVTKIIPLTNDLNVFQEELNKVYANGGGDEPEDLQAALKDAIEKIDWNREGIRLSFIITDAPPHLNYGQTYTYVKAVSDARTKGIKIFSVGTGGLNQMGEYVLRQISQYTYAKYIFLTYGEKGESEGGKPGSVSHHTGSNYQTDKLEAIIIKIAKEELSSFSDQPVEMGEDFFQASKIENEKKEETLQKLFDMTISSLIDYSTYSIADKTPTGVLPINPKDDSQKANAEYFSGQLEFSLNKNNRLKMVERQDLQKILKEHELSMTGLIEEKDAVEVGKLIGAKLLITGSLYVKDDFELFLKLVNVETGEILSVTKSKINQNLGL